MADTAKFGILRIIVSDVNTVAELLKKNNFAVKITEVIAVKVGDRPGGLNEILSCFNEADINVEYMYAFVNRSGQNANIIFKVHNIQQAINILVKNNIELLKHEEIAGI